MLLVDLNYNFEFDWFVELSDNKLSDNNLASELVGNRSFFKPITIEEIVIFMIKRIRMWYPISLLRVMKCRDPDNSLISLFFLSSFRQPYE